MRKYILTLLMSFFFVTSTFGSVAHLCPGCQPNSDVACTMHQPSSVEKESCHTPVKAKRMSCCEDSDTQQRAGDCELCADIEEPVASEKYSETKSKSKIQLDTIAFQSYSKFGIGALSPEVRYQVGLRGSPPSQTLTFLKSVRLLC